MTARPGPRQTNRCRRLAWLFLGAGLACCTPKSDTDDSADPVDTQTSGDTGDSGDTSDTASVWDPGRNGSYNGTFRADIQLADQETMSDVCLGEATLGINDKGNPQIQGMAPCAWQGLTGSWYPDWNDPTAHFEGSIGPDGLLTGGVNFGPIQDDWVASFTGETTLAGGFSGEVVLTADITVIFEGVLVLDLTSTPCTEGESC
jgi:hypothetical protein